MAVLDRVIAASPGDDQAISIGTDALPPRECYALLAAILANWPSRHSPATRSDDNIELRLILTIGVVRVEVINTEWPAGRRRLFGHHLELAHVLWHLISLPLDPERPRKQDVLIWPFVTPWPTAAISPQRG